MPSPDSSSKRFTYLVLLRDASLAVGLLLAVGVVILADRFWRSSRSSEGVETEVETHGAAEPVRVWRLAVVPREPEYDDMGSLLAVLGNNYKTFDKISLDSLLSFHNLADTNVLFVTCSTVPKSWLRERVGPAERPGLEAYTADEAVLDRAKETLRKFVSLGGTLYASDLHFNLIAHSFPEFVDAGKVNTGRVQTVDAEVVDPDLREQIGPRITLKFDQPGWRPAAFAGKQVTVYMRGTYETQDRRTGDCALDGPFSVAGRNGNLHLVPQ